MRFEENFKSILKQVCLRQTVCWDPVKWVWERCFWVDMVTALLKQAKKGCLCWNIFFGSDVRENCILNLVKYFLPVAGGISRASVSLGFTTIIIFACLAPLLVMGIWENMVRLTFEKKSHFFLIKKNKQTLAQSSALLVLVLLYELHFRPLLIFSCWRSRVQVTLFIWPFEKLMRKG